MKPASKRIVVGAALAALATIGWVDYITGYEISFVLLYAFLVGWVGFSVGLSWGIFFALASTLVSRWTDHAAGQRFSHPWIFWERVVNMLVILTFVAVTFHRFKRAIERARQRVRQLEGILPICVVCHRVRDEEGEWFDVADYLRDHTEVEPERRLCPDCSKAKYLNDYLT